MSDIEYASETLTKVRDLKEGDRVDLGRCPHLSGNAITEFEYGVVGEINIESPECHVVSYDNLSLCAGYDPDTELPVQSRITPMDE